MTVRVCYTVDVDDDFRRAINHHDGTPGLATRDAVREWFTAYGDTATDDVLYEFRQHQNRAALAIVHPDKED